MPTYSYACTQCDHRFDAVQAFTDDALTSCPECAGKLRKLFNSVGVVFKGSGFYRNDSRESTGKSAKSGSASAEKSSEKSSTPASGGDSSSASSSGSAGSSSSSSGSTNSAPATTSS